jgi:DNA invertase Pin-like site-specific DNA recombinase
MRIGYLRVSTEEQRIDRQVDALLPICDELQVETLSAVAKSRPIFEAVLARLKRGDTLVVWDLDRAFRNTKDALIHADHLKECGVNFQIVSLGVDTSTADGRLAFTVVAAVAEHERNRLSERTKQGLEATRRKGTRLGPHPKMTDRKIRNAMVRLAEGAKIKDVARYYRVHPWTVTRAIRRLETADRTQDSDILA